MASSTKKLVAPKEAEYYHKLDIVIFNCCQNLRNIFKNKWKRVTGKAWVSNKKHGVKLIKTLDKQIKTMFESGAGGKKIFLEKVISGNLEDWDITILSMILLNWEGNSSPDEYRKQNEAFTKLRDVQNFVAHLPTEMLGNDATSNIRKFQNSMKEMNVNVDEMEIKRNVEKAEIVSKTPSPQPSQAAKTPSPLPSQAAKTPSPLPSQAAKTPSSSAELEQHESTARTIKPPELPSSIAEMKKVEEFPKKPAKKIKLKKLQRELECYREPISMTNLLNQIGSIFEMTAESYLEMQECSNGKLELVEQALKDLDQALKLNESSSQARYLAARCYRKLEDYPKAIRSLKISLALAPFQPRAVRLLDECVANLRKVKL